MHRPLDQSSKPGTVAQSERPFRIVAWGTLALLVPLAAVVVGLLTYFLSGHLDPDDPRAIQIGRRGSFALLGLGLAGVVSAAIAISRRSGTFRAVLGLLGSLVVAGWAGLVLSSMKQWESDHAHGYIGKNGWPQQGACASLHRSGFFGGDTTLVCADAIAKSYKCWDWNEPLQLVSPGGWSKSSDQVRCDALAEFAVDSGDLPRFLKSFDNKKR
jgi:hypothetical protein